jgi:hypothetical protein
MEADKGGFSRYARQEQTNALLSLREAIATIGSSPILFIPLPGIASPLPLLAMTTGLVARSIADAMPSHDRGRIVATPNRNRHRALSMTANKSRYIYTIVTSDLF